MKWFGTPWPSADQRAEVCSDEANHVAVPEGALCGGCPEFILANAQGVIIPDISEDPVLELPYHLECLMAMTAGPNWRDLLEQGRPQ